MPPSSACLHVRTETHSVWTHVLCAVVGAGHVVECVDVTPMSGRRKLYQGRGSEKNGSSMKLGTERCHGLGPEAKAKMTAGPTA